jgi:hypothetical protein
MQMEPVATPDPFKETVQQITQERTAASEKKNDIPVSIISLPENFVFEGQYDGQQLSATVTARLTTVATSVDGLLEQVDQFSQETFAFEKERCKDLANGAQIAKELAEQESSKHRHELYAKHEARLMAEILKIQTAEKQSDAYAKIFGCTGEQPSAVGLASLHNLGSPERTALATQMQHFGPAELASAARLAIATKNKNLAAAVKSLNDSFPAKLRVISSSELADALWGGEAFQIWDAARQARNAVTRAMSKLRELKTGRRNATSLIASGIEQQRSGKPPKSRDENNVALGGDTPNSKISRGLNTLGEQK